MNNTLSNRHAATLLETISFRQNNFTWIRLLLSASVIYFHSFGLTALRGYPDRLTDMTWPVATVGGLAVQSFFFLSGLFVAQSYYRDPHFIHFAIKRSLRIWPGLFICLFVTTVLAVLVSQPSEFQKYFALERIYSYIVKTSVFEFIWTIDGIYPRNQSPVMNGAIHTLPLEAKMYVVLGCVGLLGLNKTPLRLLVTSGILALLCFVPGTLDRLPLHLFNADYSRTAICMFLAGMAAFGAAQWIRPLWWQGILLGILVWLTSGTVHVVVFYALVCWALLYLGQSPLLARLGSPRQDLSYGVYLYGWPSQQLVMALRPDLSPYALMVAALALASIFAYFSWHVVEYPAIKLGKELVHFRPRNGPLRMTSSSVRLTVLLVSVLMLTLGMRKIALGV